MRLKGIGLCLLLVLGLGTVALAADVSCPTPVTPNAGADLPAGASPASTWEWDAATGKWVTPIHAMAWNSTVIDSPVPLPNTLIGGSCNKAEWGFDFTNHASIAQWINWNISSNRKDWRILKPGLYASDCITFQIASNNDVTISFDGFGNLEYLADGGVKQEIDTWYGIWNGENPMDPTNVYWIPASSLNSVKLRLLDGADLHASRTFKIFSKLSVANCNSSSDYENVGYVTIAVNNLKNWVDGESGTFKANQYGQLSGGYWNPRANDEIVVPGQSAQ